MIPSEKLTGMEEIEELISYYGLEEDPEYIIVPFTDRDGKMKRRFILKRMIRKRQQDRREIAAW